MQTQQREQLEETRQQCAETIEQMKIEHEEKLSQANSQNTDTLGQEKAHLTKTLERIVPENDTKIAEKDQVNALMRAKMEKM